MVVAELSRRLRAPLKKRIFHSYLFAKADKDGALLCLIEPLTFMNASGRIIKDALRACGSATGILVVCDSLDLSPGNCRLRLRGSAGGHKGLESVARNLGTEEFMRLLIGIGRPETRDEVVDYVLGEPEGVEAAAIREAVGRAADAVLSLSSAGPERVMNELNRREPAI